jgi:hypothetical protein
MTSISSAVSLSVALILSLGSISACAESDKKKTPLESSAEIAVKCPEAIELMTLLGSKKIFTQTPEEFTQSVSGVLKTSGEKTVDAGTHQLKEMTFGEANNKWLVSAQSTYKVREKSTGFDRASFEFSPGCFAAPEDFLKLSKQQFGKKFSDRSYAPPEKILEWELPDADVNTIRTIQIAASKQRYEVKLAIDPAGSEP